MSGILRIPVMDNFGKERIFYFKTPTSEQRYLAAELYHELLLTYKFDDLYSDDEVIGLLVRNEKWSQEEENQLETIKKDIEEFKIKLSQSFVRSKDRTFLKKAISNAKKKLSKLIEKRSSYDCYTSCGLALLAKTRFLIGVSIYDEKNNRVFNESDFWKQDDPLLDSIVDYINQNRLDESIFREIARTEPWRIFWLAKKGASNIFKNPVCELADDQRTLLYWTALYDNVFEHHNCPPDEIIEDDDALDGWLILQSRERKKKSNSDAIENSISNKAKDAQEIFIPVQSPEDARKIFDMNDDFAKNTIKTRNKIVEDKGIVRDVDLPDRRKELRQAVVKKLHGKE